ncbi:MAG: membrane-bound lytic murein transglycosylase MltF [Acidiferrobacterales bacterium]
MPSILPISRAFGVTIGALILISGLLSGCTPFGESKLQMVKKAGEILVLTRNSPTTYYQGPVGPAGIEYDLARAFAKHLGVSLRIEVADRARDIVPMIANSQADFAAAGLAVTPDRLKVVRFTPPYQQVQEQLVYRAGTTPPKNLAALQGKMIDVVAGSSYIEHLRQLKLRYPGLKWKSVHDAEAEDLLIEVQQKNALFTIADSSIVALSRQFYPDLKVAFSLKPPDNLAWAFPISNDNSLYNAAVKFLDNMRRSGQLARLIERYYGETNSYIPMNIAAYKQKIQTVLPVYEPFFKVSGKKYDIDWRLLAAMAYEESYWDPNAVSPTGVRGIMMLTIPTANNLHITDPLSPQGSIDGGAEYIRDMINQLPPHIPEPDRTWMALAAYNVGINHLEDARIITQQQGGNPDKWKDVRTRLPLLAIHSWYSKTKYGYARGYEPVQYVKRIRIYYDTLVKMDREIRARELNDALHIRAPAI